MARRVDYLSDFGTIVLGCNETEETMKEMPDQRISRLLANELDYVKDNKVRAAMQAARHPDSVTAQGVADGYATAVADAEKAIECWKKIRALESVIKICSS